MRYPTTIYLIAESARAAEKLGRHYALRRRWLGRLPADRQSTIERWRRMPDAMRQRYHVHRVNVLITDDGTLVTGIVKVALCVAAGVLMGGVFH